MSEWDCIETGFNAADETINFGARSIADGGNLHEAVTIASLKNSQNVIERIPEVNAQILNNKLFFQIDTSLRTFNNTSCSSICFQAVFEEAIEAYCPSLTGEYLLVCLEKGLMHFVQLGLEDVDQKILLTTTVSHGDSKFVNAYLECETKNHFFFVIVLSKGKIMRLAIDKPKEEEGDGNEKLENSCDKESSINETIFNKTAADEKYNFDLKTIVDLSIDIEKIGFQWPYILCSGSKLVLYNLHQLTLIKAPPIPILKLIPYTKCNFVALDDIGNLMLISTRTLQCCYFSSLEPTKDCYIMVDELKEECHLYRSTLPDEIGSSQVQLLEFPSLSVIFSISCKDQVHLIQPEIINDEYLYITEIMKSGGELRVQKVIEAVPEKRLERLLRRKNYEEAEKLAIQFDLDLEIIRKAQAQEIIDQISTSEEDIKKLIEIFSSIDDIAFKLNSIKQVTCETFESVRTILDYGCRINISRKLENYKQVLTLQIDIIDNMFRFNTFMTLQACTNGRYKMEDWIHFSECNLIEELRYRLHRRRIDDCIIIYDRLDSDTCNRLVNSDIEDILEVLSSVSLDYHLTFLTHFIPTTLSYLPRTLPIFVLWLEKRIYYFQTNYLMDFPENAISFAEATLKLLKPDPMSQLASQERCPDRNFHIGEVELLMQGLKFIKNLRDNYDICISLKDYIKGPRHIISILLSVDVYEEIDNELFEVFLRKFLSPYILQNDLVPDDIYLEELRDIVQYEECYWIKFVPIIIKCITSIGNKFNAVVTILDSASLPWSAAIHELAKSVLQYDHPSAQIIKNMIVKEPVCVILQKSKYKLQNEKIRNIAELKLVVKRILYFNGPDMINDIYQVCTTSVEKQEADHLLIHHYIKIGNIIKAVAVFNNLLEDSVIPLATKLFNFGASIVDQKNNLGKMQENYLSFYEMLYEDSRPLKDEQLLEQLRAIKAVIVLEKTLDISITTFQCFDNASKNQIVELFAAQIYNGIQNSGMNISDAVKLCGQFSNYLNVDKGKVFLSVCEKLSNFSHIRVILDKVVTLDFDIDLFCLFSVLVIEKLEVQRNEIGHEQDMNFSSLFVPSEKAQMDVADIIECLKICYKLTKIAMLEAKGVEIPAVVEVFNWLQTTFHMIRPGISALIESSTPGYENFCTIKDTLHHYINIIDKSNPNNQYVTHFYNHSNENYGELVSFLEYSVQKLCDEGQSLTAFKMAINLQNNLSYATENVLVIKDKVTEVITNCVCRLLRQAFAAKDINLEFIFLLLTFFEGKFAWSMVSKALTLYKREITKFKDLAILGLHIQKYYKINIGVKICKQIIIRVKWWEKIKNCQVPYEEFFKVKTEELLERLITSQHLTVNEIIEFCQDCKLDEQVFLSIYLKHLFKSWKPDYEVIDNPTGGTKLVIKNDENELIEKSQQVVALLENEELLYLMLKKLRHSVNFYHYEVLICIINIMQRIKPNEEQNNAKLLLVFLKNYTRVSKPGQMECELWFTNFPDSQSIYILSEWRLAFTPTLFEKDDFHIIRPEINLSTYKIWFNAIESLPNVLDRDTICIYAVRDVAKQIKPESNNDWIIYPQYSDIIKSIEECVSYMTNLEKITSVLYHTVNSMPCGTDQVEIAKLCYEYAYKHKQENPADEETKRAFVKVEKKYFGVSATHILHANGLADEKYLKMVTHPQQLVEELYNDERILENANLLSLTCPDINKAVDELGKLFPDLDIFIKRRELLENWLQDSDVNCKENNILEGNNEMWKYNMKQNNLKRAIYICKSDNVGIWQSHLLETNSREDEKTENCNYAFKAKVLKCYCAITDEDTIHAVLGITYEGLINYIDKLLLISDLEYMGYKFDVENLDKCNKTELLLKLKNSLANPKAVKTMASLCITYMIEDVRIWNLIISATIKQQKSVLLKEYVCFLRNVSSCRHQTFYADAWQFIVDDSYSISSHCDREVIVKILVHNLKLIQSCPVLHALNMEKPFQRCIDLKKYEFAAMLLQFMPIEKQEIMARNILNNCSDVCRSVGNLMEFGICGVQYVKELLQGF